jgi:hypothetical protein
MAKSLLHADDAGPALLNLAEYAAHRKANELMGQSHAAVLKAISTGRIVEPAVRRDGKRWLIDPALADEQWAVNTRTRVDHPVPAKFSPRPDSEIATSTWNQAIIDAKIKKAQLIAEREEVALKRQTGELLHVRDVRKRWHQNAMSLRDAFLELPAALSRELANESNPKEVESILTAKVVAILQELANA